MSEANLENLVEELSKLSVMDIVNLTKQLEEKWGVKAAPVAVAGPAAPAAGGDAGAAEEKSEFDVILKSVPADKRVALIRVVKDTAGIGLTEAKTLVDSAPKEVKTGVSKAEAEEIAKKLKEAGAEVELK